VADQLQRRRLNFELRELLYVALGAVPGALLRWQTSVHLGPYLGGSAGADLLVNLAGCFILGNLTGPIPKRTSLLLTFGIGFCGCLTTFSSWILDVVKLIQAGRPDLGLVLIIISITFGLLSAALGRALCKLLSHMHYD